MFAVDRATNAVTTWVATASLGVNPEGIATDWSGGFFVAHSGSPGGNGVRAIDALGTATALPVVSPPWTNLEDVALVPVVSGPTALATGPGAQYSYSLDDAYAPSAFYTLILSLSVYPGWQLPGDGNQDGVIDISDAVSLLFSLFVGGTPSLPCDGGQVGSPGNVLLLDSDGNQSVDLTDAIYILAYLFRSGPEPVLGTSCVRMEGCPDACRP